MVHDGQWAMGDDYSYVCRFTMANGLRRLDTLPFGVTFDISCSSKVAVQIASDLVFSKCVEGVE